MSSGKGTHSYGNPSARPFEIFSEKSKRCTDPVRMRHGLLDGVTHTLEEVGKEFGVTRERIRQIEAKAHEKIRQHGNINKLRSY